MKSHLKILLLSALITTFTTQVWASLPSLPTQCPSATDFTRQPDNSWHWNKPYEGWGFKDWSDNINQESNMETVLTKLVLNVTISLPFKMIDCFYDVPSGNVDSEGNKLSDFYFEVGNKLPILHPHIKLTPSFNATQGSNTVTVEGSTYTCTTHANTPELCAWQYF